MRKNLSWLPLSVLSLAGTLGCASTETARTDFTKCATASCFLATVTPAQWAEAERQAIEVNFEKLDSNGAAADYAFTSPHWSDASKRVLSFQTGKPYVLKFRNRYSEHNNAAGGDAEHYFTSPEFYRSIVVQKIVTPTATYRATLLNDFELNAPAHNNKVDTEAKIYFIPVQGGVFDVVCKEGKHSDLNKRTGMVATLQIKGASASAVDFEIPTDYPASLGDPKNQLKGISYASGAKDAAYWKPLALSDRATGAGPNEPLVLDRYAAQPGYKGYVVRLRHDEGSTAPKTLTSDFFKTVALRKVHDPHVQIKPYLLGSVELAGNRSERNSVDANKPGRGEVDLFVVPTVAGDFDVKVATQAATGKTRVLVR